MSVTPCVCSSWRGLCHWVDLVPVWLSPLAASPRASHLHAKPPFPGVWPAPCPGCLGWLWEPEWAHVGGCGRGFLPLRLRLVLRPHPVGHLSARPVRRGAFTLGVERDEVRECKNAEPAAFRSASSPPSCGRVTQSESSCLSYPLGTWGRRSGTLSLLPEGQVPRRPSSDGASSRKPAGVATRLLWGPQHSHVSLLFVPWMPRPWGPGVCLSPHPGHGTPEVSGRPPGRCLWDGRTSRRVLRRIAPWPCDELCVQSQPSFIKWRGSKVQREFPPPPLRPQPGLLHLSNANYKRRDVL